MGNLEGREWVNLIKYIILTEKHWQIAEHEDTHLILAPQRQKQVDL